MGTTSSPDDVTLTFGGNATALLRLGPFTVLTDPSFLHRGQRAYLGYGLWTKRLTEPALQPTQLPALDASRGAAPAQADAGAHHAGRGAAAAPEGRCGPLDDLGSFLNEVRERRAPGEIRTEQRGGTVSLRPLASGIRHGQS